MKYLVFILMLYTFLNTTIFAVETQIFKYLEQIHDRQELQIEKLESLNSRTSKLEAWIEEKNRDIHRFYNNEMKVLQAHSDRISNVEYTIGVIEEKISTLAETDTRLREIENKQNIFAGAYLILNLLIVYFGADIRRLFKRNKGQESVYG